MTVISNTRQAAITRDYDRAESTADMIIHVVGLSLGLLGVVVILMVAANSQRRADMPSIVVYVIGLLTMLGFSAAYNVWPISRAKLILRRFDHSAIYIMIAGTYTPILAQIRSDVAATGFLIGVWLTAAVGVALKLLLPGRFERLSIVLCLFLGWSGAALYEQVAAALPILSIWLLAVGGALYSIGVLFHTWESLRFQNAIWHGFVLVAACCHYLAVLYCLARG